MRLLWDGVLDRRGQSVFDCIRVLALYAGFVPLYSFTARAPRAHVEGRWVGGGATGYIWPLGSDKM